MPPPPDNPCGEIELVGMVHDSLLYECSSHQFDRLKHHKHHWIEEGTYEDFKKCILTSDLPVVTFAFASTGYCLMGTVTGRANMPVRQVLQLAEADWDARPVPLMGTYVVPPADHIALAGHAAYVQMDHAAVERGVLDMLMNRPEVRNHEPEAKAPLAQAR